MNKVLISLTVFAASVLMTSAAMADVVIRLGGYSNSSAYSKNHHSGYGYSKPYYGKSYKYSNNGYYSKSRAYPKYKTYPKYGKHAPSTSIYGYYPHNKYSTLSKFSKYSKYDNHYKNPYYNRYRNSGSSAYQQGYKKGYYDAKKRSRLR